VATEDRGYKARRPSRTAEDAAQVLAAFRMTKTIRGAAQYLGISEEELLERMKRHGIEAPS
jgi:DNA-binding NtrC family response regulator